MKYRRRCKHCGEFFVTNRRTQKFCNKRCRIEYEEVQKQYRVDSGQGQMCWTCENACGGCSWSKELKPINGWVARKVRVKNQEGDEYSTYRIIFCPRYKQETGIKILKTRR